MNTADYFLDIASGDLPSRYETGEEIRLRCLKAAETYLKEHPEGFMTQPDKSQALSSISNVSPCQGALHQICVITVSVEDRQCALPKQGSSKVLMKVPTTL